MPPFSGKKKKEQLQAKRQRKREEELQSKALYSEREKLRDALMARGEDASEEVLDEYMRERTNLTEPTRGRHARRREKENPPLNTAHGSSSHARGKDADDSDSSKSSDEEQEGMEGETKWLAKGTVMYSADRHHGVRSVFLKESAAVIAARKRLSYQPIPCRTTIPATGIPFGEWFTFPTADAAATSGVRTGRPKDSGSGANEEAEEKLAMIAAEQQRRMERALVASAGDALGGVRSSAYFPIAVELPSRGWHLEAINDGEAVVAEANTLIPDFSATSTAAVIDQKAPVCETGEETVATDSDQNESGNDVEESDVAATDRQMQAQRIKTIEQKRFRSFVEVVDNYPLPGPLVGLEPSTYERNLEVWQQLWRTVELSDVLLIIADARYPIIHAHLGLLTYIAKAQQKPCVLVLNKEDLVPASTLRCWQQFLHCYLKDLGFNVESPTSVVPNRGNPEGSSEPNDGAASPSNRGGRVVLRTFTANPLPETAGQRDGDVDVTRRQRNRKKTGGGHLYEKLRTGKLKAAKPIRSGDGALRDSSNDDDGNAEEEADEEDELRYNAAENFVGMQAAEHALQRDRREYRELQVVADKIEELLATCRRLGAETQRKRQQSGSTDPFDVQMQKRETTSSKVALSCAGSQRVSHKRRAKKRMETDSEAKRGPEMLLEDDGAVMGGSEAGDAAAEAQQADSPSYLRLGFIGHPNVGKSSLLNCIRGTKVVSVSATPGHTKHIQTIPVPEEQLTLVDSPGLALPVYGVPRPLQAVLGTHQIAQTRDPQSGIGFLAAYLPMERTYGLQRSEDAIQEEGWSSYELCEAYARKRGFFVKHGKGALDIHRAAIALLQEAYEGRLSVFYAPPELNLLQSAWYRERVRPYLLLPVFSGPHSRLDVRG